MPKSKKKHRAARINKLTVKTFPKNSSQKFSSIQKQMTVLHLDLQTSLVLAQIFQGAFVVNCKQKHSRISGKEASKIMRKQTSSFRSSGGNSDFDPDRSNRERRKLTRKIYTESKYVALYNDEGLLVSNGADLCDCNIIECEGCHFPCVKCRSMKCGHECRRNRKWRYETFKCDTLR